MREKIKKLESLGSGLAPSLNERKNTNAKVGNYIDSFLESLPTSPGFTTGECEKLKSLSIGEQGKPIEDLLGILKNEVDKIGINSASGRHLGYIPGGGLWASAIGDLLAAVGNRYAGVAYSSPGAVITENQIIQWLCPLVGYPKTAHGNLASGGSIANLTAIQTARDWHKIDSTNVKENVVYLTGQVHHCIHKALKTTGLHEAKIRRVSMNPKFQMDVADLEAKMEKDRESGLVPFMVVATAGTTDTGAIDPLEEIGELCSKHKAWFHIDAAYGGFFVLVDKMKARFKGIGLSDSVVMDPHKTLFMPYGSGVVLVKNRQALLNSYTQEAAYMNDAYGLEDLSPADSGPELSKHFRGLRIWLPLHLHGLEPFRANLEEKFLLCRYFHEKMGEMGFETGPEPELSVALFRIPGDEKNVLNQKLIEALHRDGRVFLSSTHIDGKLWIRCAAVSFRTHLREIEMAIEMIGDAVEEIKRKPHL